jgi:hypothetical protein
VSPQDADSIRDYLTTVANRAQMQFFVQPYDVPVARKIISTLSRHRSSPLDEEAMSTLPGVIQHDLSFPRWGINE